MLSLWNKNIIAVKISIEPDGYTEKSVSHKFLSNNTKLCFFQLVPIFSLYIITQKLVRN